MQGYNKLWRAFFAVSLMAIAVQQVVVGGFRPVILPPSPAWLAGCMVCVWVGSILLFGASAAIVLGPKRRSAAIYLGFVLLLLLLVFHIPYQIKINLHLLAAWSDAFKLLALSGGAFVVAASFPGQSGVNTSNKLLPAGRFLFAVTMVVFGAMHFIYTPFVVMLIPAWLPGAAFWTYLAGAALIAGGLGIILNIQTRLAANLLGIIIFIWLITLHIPRAIADPHSGAGNEWTSVFEALGFSGIAFLIAANAKPAAK